VARTVNEIDTDHMVSGALQQGVLRAKTTVREVENRDTT